MILLLLFRHLLNTILELFFGFIIYYFSRNQRLKRKLTRSKATSPSGVKSGDYVKLVGIVEPKEKQYRAPISERKCSAFQVKAIRSPMLYEYEEDLINEEVCLDFYLLLENEKVLVIGKNAQLLLAPDQKYRSGLFKRASSNMVKHLARHKIKPTFLGMNKFIRLWEGALEVNQKAAVKGVAKWYRQREGGNPVLMLQGKSNAPLYISNLNSTFN